MGKWDVNASKDPVNDLLEEGRLTEEDHKHAFALIERGKSHKGTQYALNQADLA